MKAVLSPIHEFYRLLKSWAEPNLRFFTGNRQPLLWLLAIIVGALVSLAAIAFRVAIGAVQWTWLGTSSERVAQSIAALPPHTILIVPAVTGLLVGLLLQYVQPRQRTGGVADVIEARAQGGQGLPFRSGISSALITALSLGGGASAGREGPVVHLGATLSTNLCRSLALPDTARRILLACGVASAVSASFNAPIAGVLFAHEVILAHYALSAFVPIVLASTVGTLFTRLYFGEAAAFTLPPYEIASYWEFPAFALLGLTCAIVAVLLQASLIAGDWTARNIKLPLWLRPAIGGLAIGAIALFFPQVLGVGYEATDAALHGKLSLALMLALILAKTAATSITLASRFGGGIFSPSLYIGAMAGGAFGLIAGSAFPDIASSYGLYAILGMGAVASAVLGAPLSTTLIVFELTGGYDLSIALLLCVSISTGLSNALLGRSFFQWQLEMRGVFVRDGSHKWLEQAVHVADFMEPLREGASNERPKESETAVLFDSDCLNTALKAFDESGKGALPVVTRAQPYTIIGYAHHLAALRVFNSALIKATEEEHR
ncbi:chloride channel protein [Polycladidibacter hongkongensis]|uniref:chloride channel protein n=1 Tax=Polycladidibacter hongkongensis TaxID=1647556 RepID=UPI00082CB268|nr:chloride channel protein [Pseudovibrio hongkongensis]